MNEDYPPIVVRCTPEFLFNQMFKDGNKISYRIANGVPAGYTFRQAQFNFSTGEWDIFFVHPKSVENEKPVQCTPTLYWDSEANTP